MISGSDYGAPRLAGRGMNIPRANSPLAEMRQEQMHARDVESMLGQVRPDMSLDEANRLKAQMMRHRDMELAEMQEYAQQAALQNGLGMDYNPNPNSHAWRYPRTSYANQFGQNLPYMY